jgi:hypothetical protein
MVWGVGQTVSNNEKAVATVPQVPQAQVNQTVPATTAPQTERPVYAQQQMPAPRARNPVSAPPPNNVVVVNNYIQQPPQQQYQQAYQQPVQGYAPYPNYDQQVAQQSWNQFWNGARVYPQNNYYEGGGYNGCGGNNNYGYYNNGAYGSNYGGYGNHGGTGVGISYRGVRVTIGHR